MTLPKPSLFRDLFLALWAVYSLSLSAIAQNDNDEKASFDAAATRSPAVAAVLDMPHESPAERLGAVFTLLDLGELEVAAALLKPVIQLDLDNKACAGLVEKFGTARFLNLARRDKTASADEGSPLAGARKFVQRCLQSAAEYSQSPERLASLVAKLNDQAAEARNAARVDLSVTGTAGAKACLEALANEKNELRRANLMLALAKMRPEVDPLLLAILADGRGQLLRDVAELSGHIGFLDAAPLLGAVAIGDDADSATAAQLALEALGLPRPDADDARALLKSEIERLEAGVGADRRASWDDVAPWWDFAGDRGKLIAENFSSDDRQFLAIARLARVLTSLPGALPEDRQLALVYAFEVTGKFNRSLPPAMATFTDSLSTQALSGTLGLAVHRNRIAAAISCVELLGQRADGAALSSFDGRPTPLAEAVAHADRGLRFAALSAVMKLSPSKSFAGASHVPQALWDFAAGPGAPQAIAASPVATRASDWAGQLRALGFDATPTRTGSETLKTAHASPRLALVLVDSDIGRPLLRETLYQIRSSGAMARVPVAILSSLPHLERARRMAENDPLLLAIARPHDDDAMKNIVGQIEKLHPLPSPELRMQQATSALEWIAELLKAGHPYDELLRNSGQIDWALNTAELAEPALDVLSLLGTAQSQRSLVDFVSNRTVSLELRQQAVSAFASSVSRYGKLLTPSEITQQFDRYNASETADKDTQRVLGQLLDILEDKPLGP